LILFNVSIIILLVRKYKNRKKIYQPINKCRICGNKKLTKILSLGKQTLTSVFVNKNEKKPNVSPLDLIYCDGPYNKVCNLVQLKHTADIGEMYGTTYGYLSSISPTMISHLQDVKKLTNKHVKLKKNDRILDIGCNDGTLLNLFAKDKKEIKLTGIDPSSSKFRKLFNKRIQVIEKFFNKGNILKHVGNVKFKAITSIAMFYDIDNPSSFVKDISDLLDDNGIWIVEVAYLSTMMKNLAYDQIMHEHLTYLGFKQMHWLIKENNLKIIDFSTNLINGGSIIITVAKNKSKLKSNKSKINNFLTREKKYINSNSLKLFKKRVESHKKKVVSVLNSLKKQSKKVIGYGASTKGNVIINYCKITKKLIPKICDENKMKDGQITPGSRIPIITKQAMRKYNPDFLYVFIWPFRKEVLITEKDFIQKGGTMIFNLPKVHFINKKNYNFYLNSSLEDLSFK